MDHQKKSIAIFDVCDTLYYSNTTYDFIYFFLKQQGDKKRLHTFKRNVNRKLPWLWIDVIKGKLLKKDISKMKAVSLLKGYSKMQLYQSAEMFSKLLTNNRKIEETHALMMLYKWKGYDVVLCSSSIDPVISKIAEHLGVSYVCTELDYSESGFCGGRIKFDITGNKHISLTDVLKSADKENIAVVSDNRSDKKLFSFAGKQHVVLYDAKDKANWMEIEGDFIVLKKVPYTYE